MSALLGCVDPGDGVRADFEPVQVFGKQFRKCRAALTVLGGRRFEKLPSRIGKKVIPEFLRGIAEVVGNDGEQLGDHLLQYDGPGEDGIHDVLVRGHDDSPVDPFAVYQDPAQPQRPAALHPNDVDRVGPAGPDAEPRGAGPALSQEAAE